MAEVTGASLVNATQPGATLVGRFGDWSVNHVPVANTVATISKAAAPGVRHVCTGISARIVGGTAAPAAVLPVLNLRDGATGAGTILMSWTLSLAAAVGARDEINLTGLNIPGSVNTAMTLEFVAGGGANTLESVNLTGYSL